MLIPLLVSVVVVYRIKVGVELAARMSFVTESLSSYIEALILAMSEALLKSNIEVCKATAIGHRYIREAVLSPNQLRAVSPLSGRCTMATPNAAACFG